MPSLRSWIHSCQHAPARAAAPRPRVFGTLLTALLLVTLSAPATAQLQFEELRNRGFPDVHEYSKAVVTGDVDGDGDVDVLIGNGVGSATGGQNRLYLNDGAGGFVDVTATHLPARADATTDLVFGDFDGDGDLDFVEASAGAFFNPQPSRLYVNDGSGVFSDVTATQMPAAVLESRCLVAGDVDGDGDLDLVVGTEASIFSSGQDRLYLNDGSGTFTDATTGRMPVDNAPARAVVLGDVDGDGDLDVVVGNSNSSSFQNRLYLNDGSGTFSDATSQLPTLADFTTSIDLGDVDGDGDLDLIVANAESNNQGVEQNQLYLNDGAGTFVDATATRMPVDSDSPSAVRFGDVDGDGDLDAVFASWPYAYELRKKRIYINDGTGTFVDETAARTPADWSAADAIALADLDGDGDLDVLSANSGGANGLWWNDGAGVFVDATAGRDVGSGGNGAALGDVDGDGDLDLVVATGYPTFQNRLFLNDGRGNYGDATTTHLPADGDSSVAVALGDVDGDGDLDLVFGNGDGTLAGGQNRLYLNDGSGVFSDATASAMPVDADNTAAVALGDVDGDGDLDLVFGNDHNLSPGSVPSRLYLNDGAGTFTDVTAARMPVNGDATQAVALGDADGDGDLDLVLGKMGACGGLYGGCSGAQNRFYANDGTGTFTDETAARMPVDGDLSVGAAMGDVDGDGDLDLVFANRGLFAQSRLYLNDGAGNYTDATASQLPVGGHSCTSVDLGDVDGDGDLDLVFGSRIACANMIPICSTGRDDLLLNDGSGSFVDVTARLPAVEDATQAVALGDVDGDGDLDLVALADGNVYSSQSRLYLNLLRQLDAPFLARPGRDYTLEVYARYGGPRLFDVALPFVSLAPASIATPFGPVGIDPGSAFPLPPLLVPQPAGVGAATIAVPNLPALAGIEVYGQALLVQWPLLERMTNVTVDRVFN